MPTSDNLTSEQRKRADEKVRSLATKIESRKSYHSPGDCDDCRDGPCGAQFEIWTLEREIEGWKQQPLQQIENEDRARKLEDEYFLHLISSHANVLNRFVEIVERQDNHR